MRKVVTPACDKSKQPIYNILKDYLVVQPPARNMIVLEIASGSGQHIHHFSGLADQRIIWIPSEFDPALLDSIRAYAKERKNIFEPLLIDVRETYMEWPEHTCIKPGGLDIIFCANLSHYGHFACTEGLFWNASKLLKPDGSLFLYGPFFDDGTAATCNVDLDYLMRQTNRHRGVRDITVDLIPAAAKCGLRLDEKIELPAENYLLRWVIDESLMDDE